LSDIYVALAAAIIDGNAAEALERLEANGADRMDEDRLLEAISGAMDEVGRRYETGEYFIPEMLAAARTVKALFAAYAAATPRPPATAGLAAAIGTVRGDVHDIGKEIIINSLAGLGIRVVDLGVNVEASRYVRAVADGADLLLIAAFTTVTRRYVRVVLSELEAAGLRDRARVLVGGVAATPQFCRDLGVGYFRDVRGIVDFVRHELLHRPMHIRRADEQ